MTAWEETALRGGKNHRVVLSWQGYRPIQCHFCAAPLHHASLKEYNNHEGSHTTIVKVNQALQLLARVGTDFAWCTIIFYAFRNVYPDTFGYFYLIGPKFYTNRVYWSIMHFLRVYPNPAPNPIPSTTTSQNKSIKIFFF